MSQHEVHEQIVALCHVGDHRALPLALEQFEHHPSPASMRLVALAARSRGLVLPSRHHPDHLAVRFTYSLESAISDVLDGLSADEREDCLAVLGRGSRCDTAPRASEHLMRDGDQKAAGADEFIEHVTTHFAETT